MFRSHVKVLTLKYYCQKIIIRLFCSFIGTSRTTWFNNVTKPFYYYYLTPNERTQNLYSSRLRFTTWGVCAIVGICWAENYAFQQKSKIGSSLAGLPLCPTLLTSIVACDICFVEISFYWVLLAYINRFVSQRQLVRLTEMSALSSRVRVSERFYNKANVLNNWVQKQSFKT